MSKEHAIDIAIRITRGNLEQAHSSRDTTDSDEERTTQTQIIDTNADALRRLCLSKANR